MISRPAWLTARAVAHRGLHDASSGRVENTLPAFEAAIARGFAIECDVQLTADAQAVVFHDDTLDRLTSESGAVVERPLNALAGIDVTGSGSTILSLARFLAAVGGRTPVLIEMKSRFNGVTKLADAVAGALGAYSGPAAVMSFDPALVARFKTHKTGHPVGIVAMPMRADDWPHVSPIKRLLNGLLLSPTAFKADFIAYDQRSLPAPAPFAARYLGGKALLSWTVKDAQTAKRIRRYVHQIIFEGFDPHAGSAA